jgi:hypothetical protein
MISKQVDLLKILNTTMMKKITLSIVAVLFCSTAFVSAQNLNKILDNYFEVLGQETILDAKTSETTGKMLQMGMEIPFKQYSAAPNKFRIEATFQDMTLISTFNGKEGWSINPFLGSTEPVAMTDDVFKSTEIQADYEGQLWNWKDKGYTVSLEKNEEVEGVDCFVIKAVSKDEDVFTFFIDTESYVLIRLNSKMKIQEQIVEYDTFMSNYQEGDGFIYAGKMETKIGGQITATIVIDEMTLGEKYDSSLFEKPVK